MKFNVHARTSFKEQDSLLQGLIEFQGNFANKMSVLYV